MKITKKGIEPTKEDNTQTQNHSNKFEGLCLVLFALFVILTIAGKWMGNDRIEFTGIGIGLTVMIMITRLIKED